MIDLLTAYHKRLSACLWPHQVEHEDMTFRDEIKDDPPAAIDRILTAHRRRVAGKSSPAECDDLLQVERGTLEREAGRAA